MRKRKRDIKRVGISDTVPWGDWGSKLCSPPPKMMAFFWGGPSWVSPIFRTAQSCGLGANPRRPLSGLRGEIHAALRIVSLRRNTAEACACGRYVKARPIIELGMFQHLEPLRSGCRLLGGRCHWYWGFGKLGGNDLYLEVSTTGTLHWRKVGLLQVVFAMISSSRGVILRSNWLRVAESGELPPRRCIGSTSPSIVSRGILLSRVETMGRCRG